VRRGKGRNPNVMRAAEKIKVADASGHPWPPRALSTIGSSRHSGSCLRTRARPAAALGQPWPSRAALGHPWPSRHSGLLPFALGLGLCRIGLACSEATTGLR
jgi:hypothetical protein